MSRRFPGIREPAAQDFEWGLALLSVLLACIGFVLIYSATTPMGDTGRGYVIKQITWACLGFALMAGFMLLDFGFFERWAVPLHLALMTLLIVAVVTGRVTSGSQRWLDLGFMKFQPSEFIKVSTALVLAKILRPPAGASQAGFRELALAAAAVLPVVILVRIQPDLGTAVVILLIAVSMVGFSRIGRKVLGWFFALMCAAAPILYFLGDKLLLDYQKRRLITYLNPGVDPLGAGYHILQSQIAIGEGGLWGKGFLQGPQNQLMFLPATHTDFIFSVLAEEWGFVGCAVTLFLFLLLFLRMVSIAGTARDDFAALASFGCAALIFWPAIINVGMVTGLVPVVGVPLSFISYGGSALVSCFGALGVVANAGMRRFS
jgi:rod shape determining protein RodA